MYDRTHIIAIVCVSAAKKTVRATVLWTEKRVPGRFFSKDACPLFNKATYGDSEKDSQKAPSRSDSNAHDRKQKPKETEIDRDQSGHQE